MQEIEQIKKRIIMSKQQCGTLVIKALLILVQYWENALVKLPTKKVRLPLTSNVPTLTDKTCTGSSSVFPRDGQSAFIFW